MKKNAKQCVRKRKNRILFAYLLGSEIRKGYKKPVKAVSCFIVSL